MVNAKNKTVNLKWEACMKHYTNTTQKRTRFNCIHKRNLIFEIIIYTTKILSATIIFSDLLVITSSIGHLSVKKSLAIATPMDYHNKLTNQLYMSTILTNVICLSNISSSLKGQKLCTCHWSNLSQLGLTLCTCQATHFTEQSSLTNIETL